jgi:hypothetical protein
MWDLRGVVVEVVVQQQANKFFRDAPPQQNAYITADNRTMTSTTVMVLMEW